MFLTIDRPSPVPEPARFVVKNGLKMRARFCGLMPHPVSWTTTATRAGSFGAATTAAVVTVRTALRRSGESPTWDA